MFSAFPPNLQYNAFGFMDSHGMLDDNMSLQIPVVVDNNNDLFVSTTVWSDNFKATGYVNLDVNFHNQYKWSFLVWTNPTKVQRIADWSLRGSLLTKCGARQELSVSSSYEESFYMYVVRGFRRNLATFFPYFTISLFINVDFTPSPSQVDEENSGLDTLPLEEGVDEIAADSSPDLTLPDIGDTTDIGLPTKDVDVRAEFNPLYPQQGFRIYNIKTGKLDWTTYYAYDNHSGAIDGETLRKLGYDAPEDFYVLEFAPNGKLIFAHPE